MIRLLRLLFLAALAVVLMTVALANRDPVTLRALPEGVAGLVGFTGAVEMPLFLVIFGGIVLGLLIGFVWEWLREHKHRATAAEKSREVARLEKELAARRAATASEGGDEVLALLEQPRKAG